MKALDTSVLLGLLEGDPRARALLHRWRGVEVATTEANLLELYSIVARTRGPARAPRLASLTRLRHDLTVLPIDSRSAEAAARRLPKNGTIAPLTLGMLGALEAYGCDELATERPGEIPGGWSFPVTAYGKKAVK
ncbi:MAG: type II toxin-antitoxin system VapC family toxin [Thermoplasmata archaeon]